MWERVKYDGGYLLRTAPDDKSLRRGDGDEAACKGVAARPPRNAFYYYTAVVYVYRGNRTHTEVSVRTWGVTNTLGEHAFTRVSCTGCDDYFDRTYK